MITEIGKKTSPLWVIVHSPTETEFKQGRLFASTHGTILSRALGPAKSKAFITCLRQNKAATKDQIQARADELATEANHYQPNMVVLLGKEPLQIFEEKTSINAWRGVPFSSLSFPHKVLATFSPEGVRRQRFVPKAQHPGQYEALFNYDIDRAVGESETHELNLFHPRGIVIDEYDHAVTVLEKIKAEKKPTSFDIEIIKPYSAHFMDCIGISNSLEEGYCFVFYRGRENPVYSQRQYAKILSLINDILSDPDIPKVAQNALFDMGILEAHYGMGIHNLVWDTMVAQQNIYCELPKDLGTLTSLFTRLPYLKHLAKTDRYMYCAMDAVSNLHVMQGEIAEMRELGIYEHFQSITMPSLNTIHRMHVEGVNVDVPLMESLRDMTNNQLAAICGFFNEVFPYSINPKDKFSKFNPGSPQQKQFLLHQILGCPIKKNRGRITVDKNYLQDVVDGPNKLARPFAELLLKYSAAQKLNGSMNVYLNNGRMHTKYGIGGEDEDMGTGEEMGTLTGRLNSKKTDLFTAYDGKKYVAIGRNLQNTKAGPERAILIPDPGNVFVYCDLWAAEAFFVALEAQDVEMMAMLKRREKLHDWMQKEIRAKYPGEYELAGFADNDHKVGYKKSKQIIHSLNYAVEAPEMARNSGLPLFVCEWIYKMYHEKFPGIKRRQKKIKDMVHFQRHAESPLGRKWQIVAPFNSKTFDPLKQAYAYGSQSGIGEVTQIAASNIYYRGLHKDPWCFPRLNAHDGLAIECREEDLEAVRKVTIQAFNIPLSSGDVSITIPIEHGWGPNYNEQNDMRIHFYE